MGCLLYLGVGLLVITNLLFGQVSLFLNSSNANPSLSGNSLREKRETLLRILILEDDLLDVELIKKTLEKEFNFESKVLYKEADFIQSLKEFRPEFFFVEYMCVAPVEFVLVLP